MPTIALMGKRPQALYTNSSNEEKDHRPYTRL